VRRPAPEVGEDDAEADPTGVLDEAALLEEAAAAEEAEEAAAMLAEVLIHVSL
jgi:hypothetical protein